MKTANAKFIQVAEMIRERAQRGEYLNVSLPGAPKLAQELGISYLTIRKAMAWLVDSGEFIRQDNGRIFWAGSALEKPRLKVAYIMPHYVGINYRWRNAIANSAHDFGCSFTDILYLRCDDPIVFEALDQDFDVIFMQIPVVNNILLQKMLTKRDKLVSLFEDMTHLGIRCIDGLSHDAIGILMKFLVERGFDKIDYFCMEMKRVGVDGRKKVWSRSLKELNCTGNLYESYCEYGTPTIAAALEYAKELVAAGRFSPGQAVYCNNIESAQGLIRALFDVGLRVPEDVSVVSFGNPERATVNTPSITIVSTPDLRPVTDRVFKYYLGKSASDKELSYCIGLADIPQNEILWHGESVGFGPGIKSKKMEKNVTVV